MKLVIVESPTKAKTINWYLKGDYKVVASNGHIRDLSLSGNKSFGVDIDNNFTPDYKELDRSKRVISYMKKIALDADQIFIATDPDREGEAIAWHIAEVLNIENKDRNRLVFNEITKSAVLNAVKDTGKIDMDLVRSQETRRILDRLMGFELSSLLQKKIKARSGGRVQSATLKIIVDRETEIENFKEETTYSLEGKKDKSKVVYVDDDLKEIRKKDKKEIEKIMKSLNEEFEKVEFIEEEKERYPYFPYTTSSLQQDAFFKLRFSSSKTNKIAQQLYEGLKIDNKKVGLITYMRTDSTRISGVFAFPALELIENDFGEEYKGFFSSTSKKTGKKIQDAHEAIRITYASYKPKEIKKFLTLDQFKLYELIWVRTMSSLMKAQKYLAQTLVLKNKDYKFIIKGKKQLFDGFLKLYSRYEESKFIDISLLNEKEKITVENIEIKEHKTKPPYRYSEASIIKKMEEEGIGRPSTYSSTIESLKKSAYIRNERRFLMPTDKGKLVNKRLQEFFDEFINSKYTSKMEKDLDKIADGDYSKDKLLKDFYFEFKKHVDLAFKEMKEREVEKVGEKCPKCGKELIKEIGRYGPYICCEDRSECGYIKPKEKKQLEVVKDCPKCDGKLVKRKGRYGYFLGCNNFPKCRHVEKIEK